MIRISILTLLLAVTSHSLPGQVFNIGTGITFSQVDYDLHDSQGIIKQFTDPVKSYSLLAGFEFMHKKRFSFTSGLHFYNTGGKYSGEELANAIHEPVTRVSFHYASVYSTLNYNPLNKRFKFQIQAGPRLDLLALNNMDDIWQGMQENISTLNYGFIAGAGMYYVTGKHQVGIHASRYFRKLKTIDKENPSPRWLHFQLNENNSFLNVSFGWVLK